MSDLNLEVLAALRNAVVGLLHQRRVPNRAAALRANAWAGPAAVLGLLGLKLCMALPTASRRLTWGTADVMLMRLSIAECILRARGPLLSLRTLARLSRV